ncbi:hypothetical protein [Parafilimonas sp.]|uniref:hypothetical protein n=1 Tax=Parafilimonas sp. TaxID=1969739 RepID=UPI0039E565D1
MKRVVLIRLFVLPFSIIILAIGIITLLAWLSNKEINRPNGFKRIFKPVATLVSFRPINNRQITSISGLYNNHLYFETKDPSVLFETNLKLNSSDTLKLHLTASEKISSLFESIVDSGVAYLFAKNVPAVFTENLNTEAVNYYQFPFAIYSRSVIISPTSFVMRVFDTLRNFHDQTLIKGNSLTNHIERNDGLIERYGDGGISTDGLLHYDKNTNLITYISFYSDNIICFDTSFHIIYKGQTIDTIHSQQAKIGSIKGLNDKMYTNIAPNRIINWTSCVYSGLLFNNSKIKADNESKKEFFNNSAIDIYFLKTGKYYGSIYIPFFRGEKLQQFKVFKHSIVALYPDYIALYTVSY